MFEIDRHSFDTMINYRKYRINENNYQIFRLIDNKNLIKLNK